jgi:hypothetical protein
MEKPPDFGINNERKGCRTIIKVRRVILGGEE